MIPDLKAAACLPLRRTKDRVPIAQFESPIVIGAIAAAIALSLSESMEPVPAEPRPTLSIVEQDQDALAA